MRRMDVLIVLALGMAAAVRTTAAEASTGPESKGLEVAQLERTDSVDFHREIVPMLQVNCLPCHNKTTPKADLLMETPADMLKGGESGPAVVPGKSRESLLFQLAAHLEKPRMPPKDNKVNAVHLSPGQLALLSLWIDQGARATGTRDEIITWQPLAEAVHSILATAISPDAQWAVCGRGNRLEIYHLPTARTVGLLVDPALAPGVTATATPGAAHLDWVNAVAFSPDGRRLASGGFREIKIWERVPTGRVASGQTPMAAAPVGGIWSSPDGSRQVHLDTHAIATLTDASGKPIVVLSGDSGTGRKILLARATVERLRAATNQLHARLEVSQKEVQSQRERLKRAREAFAAASVILSEKNGVLARVTRERLLAEVHRDGARQTGMGDTNAPTVKAAEERLTAARAVAEKAEGEQRPAVIKASTAENEVALALEGEGRAESLRSRTAWLLQEARLELVGAEAALENATREGAPSPILAAAFSPDSQWLATADASGRLVRWAATRGVAVDALPVAGTVKALGFSSTDILDFSTTDGTFSVDWTPRWRWLATLTHTPEGPLADRIGALAFSPDGRWLVSGGGEPSRSGELWFWNPETLKPVFGMPRLHSDAILSVAFSPDGRWLATGGADRFARLVEVASGRETRTLEGHSGHVLGVGWRSDGLMLATAGADLLVKFWDPVTGERRKQASGFGHEVTAISHLAGTDQWVAASGDVGLRVINENGDRVRGLSGAEDFTQSMAASPDGQWVLAGGQEGVLRVWASGDEQPRLQFAPEPRPRATASQ